MTGTKGMTHSKPRPAAVRRQIWQSMRILRRFTLPDLCRTVPAATYGNVRKFVASLLAHGYVGKNGRYTGGRAGEYQIYRLIIDAGPEYPTVCAACGCALSVKECKKKEKETKKETETENERETEKQALAGGDR